MAAKANLNETLSLRRINSFTVRRNRMNKLKYLTLLLLLSVVACVRAQADPAAGDVGEVIVLNKADFLTKVFNYEKNPSKWTYEGDKPCIIDF